MKYYTGIGSRSTPINIIKLMEQLGGYYARQGFTLRSGGAQGADSAFERGALEAGGPCNIYLPWAGFNNHRSSLNYISDEALHIAARNHPNWEACSGGARRLHARNVYQILGYNLNVPTAFVVCWTPNGAGGGGTGQALRIAQVQATPIPIFDLGKPEVEGMARDLLFAQQETDVCS